MTIDPHDDPNTRWETGPDGEWTIVPLWDGKPEWLRDDERIRFQSGEGWTRACDWHSNAFVWADKPAFFLRRRPQVDKALVALIYDASGRSLDALDEARDIARALLAAGWLKGDA